MSVTTMMNIPETIHVGYQERDDTYTKKLAYVVYTDAKGKLRKEKSWNGWRDNKIDPEDYKNEPTSGFVLNKKVGGGNHGWNSRNEYIRVFDPRGFEFEISVANLLFILQECTSSKGKGLEGEFVYAWDGADLVLLPIGSREYHECVNYTENQTKKITKNDMIEGCAYLMKNMVDVMYLGRHDWYESERDWKTDKYAIVHKGKKHIFKEISDEEVRWREYIIQTGFTKLAQKTSDAPLPQYADAYDKFKKSMHSSPAKEVKLKRKKINLKDFDGTGFYNEKTYLMKEDNQYYVASITKVQENRYNASQKDKPGTFNITKSTEPFLPELEKGGCVVPRTSDSNCGYYNSYPSKNKINITEKELLKKEFYTAAIMNETGGAYSVIDG